MASWKRDIASGLIVLLPVIVTLYVIAYLYGIIASSTAVFGINLAVLTELGVPRQALGLVRVLTTLIVFFLLVLSVGYLSRTAFGDIFEDILDNLMNRLPGLRVVYNASKMAVETAVSGTEDLQKPVKIETWNGLRMTAFKTGKTTDDGRDVLFLPTAPNITTGFVIEVESEEYDEMDERVEDALTRILSAGFGESRDDSVAISVTDELSSDGDADD
ncbi:DUF502 domain-containing protein [Halorientalis regularis]|jgi:uncharacterized membrane protein|uniref:Uncharacterized membrane protein n=1 Tax=Halorientalis regularis TaxID=660518 RepID=A0A1G7GLW0_9EURY|nr:DUF502 domain-containing protein [Halorientalis regularis]SDE88969.1 Uncharacterized membrane protein [Halorientalis regularis]